MRDVRRTDGGRELRGRTGKRVDGVMGCFLDDLGAFGINADQWMTAAQDEGGHLMAQNGRTKGGTFHGEMGRCRESQGCTTACSSMPERDRKNQGEVSPKQACSCWFVRHCSLATSDANLYPPGVFADAILPFSGFVLFRFFCFH